MLQQKIMGTTVIIGFAEALSAPEVAWSLVDQGFCVMAFSRRGRQASLRHSRFVQVFEVTPPEVDLAQAMEDIKSAVLRLSENSSDQLVLMPLDDEAVWLCGRTDFNNRMVLSGPQGEAVEIALNKQKQIELAQAAGFNVPWTRFIERPEEALAGPIDFPVVFKSAMAVVRNSAGISKGRSWICSDRQELQAAVISWAGQGPMLLQKFIPGVGEGLFGLATAHGVQAWSGHRRLRMMNPHGSGASACAAVTDLDCASQAAGELFLASCNWRGLFMIELLRDHSGKLWFIELNGRSWGSMALARRSGLEYPAWAVQLALQPAATINVPAQRDGSLVCRHLGRELVHLLFVLRGSKSKALTDWPSFWKTCSRVLRIRRNERWYNWRSDDRRVFVSDTLSTLRNQLFKFKGPI
jgi:predicted ATP-grasp superfamily ATP-dependent carboligase